MKEQGSAQNLVRTPPRGQDHLDDGRSRAPGEKGDLRRRAGGPGQPDHQADNEREAGKPRDLADPLATPLEALVVRERPKANRERHADKQQPEEAGPGRASKTPPKSGRY